ncbi:MAG: MAPEG family protein [Novosphingobium sp.]|uniref:MAPEG family protein n=1 Tax=Novosphingobium sp. TaxID=1874826 RepID=UPI00301B4AF9
MIILPVTALVTAICAIMLLITAFDTVRQRMRLGAAFGDKGDAKLISASRSHANLAEHAPIVILMLGILEMAHASPLGLKVVAGLFLAARAAHIVGLYAPVDTKPPLPRSLGVIGTWLTMLVLAGWCLVLAAQA